MPQLDPTTFSPQIIWLAITFGITFVLMWKIAIPKIEHVLEARQFRIEDNLSKAEEHKREANTAMETYETTIRSAREKARQEVLEANVRIAELLQKKNDELDTKLLHRFNETDNAINSALDIAMKNISSMSETLTVSLAKRLTGETPESKRVKSAVSDVIDNLAKGKIDAS